MPSNGYNDDDDSDYGRESSRYGRNSSSHSGSSDREHYSDTSNFSTTMISEDGRFFGMKLPKDLAEKARQISPILLTIATEKGEELAAKKFSPGVGNAVGYGIALSEQAIQIVQHMYASAHNLNDLRIAVQPLEKTSGNAKSVAPLSGNNEVVANARAKISAVFWQGMVDTAVSTIGAIPALANKMSKAKNKNHHRELDKEMEAAAGNPDKIAEVLEKELTGTLTGHGSKGWSQKDIQLGKQRYIEKMEAAYQARFNEFKVKAKPEIANEINEAFKGITPENLYYKKKDLKKLGVDTDRLDYALKDNSHDYMGNPIPPADDAAKQAIINKFSSDYTAKKGNSHFARLEEEALKAKFVQREGAWDNSWLPESERRGYNSYNSGYGEREQRTLTQREQIEQDFRKLEEERRKIDLEKTTSLKGHGQDDTLKTLKDGAWGLAAGVSREFLTKLTGGKIKEQYAKPIALDRILHLRRVLQAPKDSPDWQPPEEVPPYTDPNGERNRDDDRNSNGKSYVRFVHEIFQQHQKDSKWVDIGDRFFQHFEKERWDDAAIQKMPDEELTPYEYAVKTIAKRLKDGRMDSIALVDLVGDHFGKKIVQSDGRTFGPVGAGKKDDIVKVAIGKLLDEKTAALHAGQEKTDEQVNDKLGNFIFSVDDMKVALESKAMIKDEQAFIFTLFSDVVGSDVKLCQKLGIKNERCLELRKESKETFNAMLDGAVDVLAEMIQSDPEVLKKKLNITDKEMDLIRTLEERKKEQGTHVVDLTENREEVTMLETLAANATMKLGKEIIKIEGDEKPQNFWQKLVAATKKPKLAKEPEKKNNYAKSGSDDAFADDSISSLEKPREKSNSSKKWSADEPEKSNFKNRLDSDGDLAGDMPMGERMMKKRSKASSDPTYTQAV